MDSSGLVLLVVPVSHSFGLLVQRWQHGCSWDVSFICCAGHMEPTGPCNVLTCLQCKPA